MSERFSIKDNRMVLGWEDSFRRIGGTETNPVYADLDWVISTESIDFGDLKPKSERVQKHYVNNPTRKQSYTYDSHMKAGESSLKGELKNARIIDAILGITTIVDDSGYTSVTFDGNGDSRKTFFGYFLHGTERAMALRGMIAHELTIDAKEGELVSFDLGVYVAKKADMTPISNIDVKIALIEDLGREAFHWKHVSIMLVDGDPTGTLGVDYENLLTESRSSYSQANLVTASEYSGSISLTPSTAYYFKVSVGGAAAVEYTFNSGTTTTTFTALCAKMKTAITVLGDNYFFRMVGGHLRLVSLDGTTVVLSAGTTAINLFANVVFVGTFTNGSSIDGTEFESIKLTIKNTTEMKYGAPSTGSDTWADWFKEQLLEYSFEITLYPHKGDTIIWKLGPSENNYSNYVNLLKYGQLGVIFKFERSANDYILFKMKKMEVDTDSEALSAIEDGVDPVTLGLKFAESSSNAYITTRDTLLRTVSPYSKVP